MKRQSDLKVYSKIIVENGTPKLFINGEKVVGDSYVCYYSNKNCYEDFSKNGFNLFSICLYFAKRTFNESSQFPPFMEGMFEEDSKHFAIFDEEVERITKVNPNAHIFIRLHVSLPKSWDLKHPEELNDNGQCGKDPRPCFSSDLYFEDVKEHIKKFVEYVQNSKYGERIIGYQISDGNTQEWMAMDYAGSQGKRSREKYDLLVKEGKYKNCEEQYYEFLNDVIAERICELCSYVKKITENRLIVGSFYGYTTVLTDWRFGHCSLDKVLECKDVDFLCSPIAYWKWREPGEPHPDMPPVESLRLHGKYFFAENDTRTDLTTFGCDLPAYHGRLWIGPNREMSLGICKMHFANSLIKNHTYWWFDMWGGWFAHKDYLNLFKSLKALSEKALNEDNYSTSEVAVIEDEKSYLYAKDPTISMYICRDSLGNVLKTSATVDVYLASDFEKIKNNYKAFIVPKAYDTPNIDRVLNELKKLKKPYLIIDENNYTISSDEVRQFLKKSGVTLRYENDVVLLENNRYFFIYACEDSHFEAPIGINLKPLIDAQKFPLYLKKGNGFFYEKI